MEKSEERPERKEEEQLEGRGGYQDRRGIKKNNNYLDFTTGEVARPAVKMVG